MNASPFAMPSLPEVQEAPQSGISTSSATSGSLIGTQAGSAVSLAAQGSGRSSTVATTLLRLQSFSATDKPISLAVCKGVWWMTNTPRSHDLCKFFGLDSDEVFLKDYTCILKRAKASSYSAGHQGRLFLMQRHLCFNWCLIEKRSLVIPYQLIESVETGFYLGMPIKLKVVWRKSPSELRTYSFIFGVSWKRDSAARWIERCRKNNTGAAGEDIDRSELSALLAARQAQQAQQAQPSPAAAEASSESGSAGTVEYVMVEQPVQGVTRDTTRDVPDQGLSPAIHQQVSSGTAALPTPFRHTSPDPAPPVPSTYESIFTQPVHMTCDSQQWYNLVLAEGSLNLPDFLARQKCSAITCTPWQLDATTKEYTRDVMFTKLHAPNNLAQSVRVYPGGNLVVSMTHTCGYWLVRSLSTHIRMDVVPGPPGHVMVSTHWWLDTGRSLWQGTGELVRSKVRAYLHKLVPKLMTAMQDWVGDMHLAASAQARQGLDGAASLEPAMTTPTDDGTVMPAAMSPQRSEELPALVDVHHLSPQTGQVATATVVANSKASIHKATVVGSVRSGIPPVAWMGLGWLVQLLVVWVVCVMVMRSDGVGWVKEMSRLEAKVALMIQRVPGTSCSSG